MSKASVLQTEFPFTLPLGYQDADGNIHRDGIMRRATGEDEVEPARDPRVKENPQFAMFIVLGRVITKLGTLKVVNADVVKKMFAQDLRYLQKLYNEINGADADALVNVTCPECGAEFKVPLGELGN